MSTGDRDSVRARARAPSDGHRSASSEHAPCSADRTASLRSQTGRRTDRQADGQIGGRAEGQAGGPADSLPWLRVKEKGARVVAELG